MSEQIEIEIWNRTFETKRFTGKIVCPFCTSLLDTVTAVRSHAGQVHTDFRPKNRYGTAECEVCGTEFGKSPQKENRFCSISCANKARRDRVELTCEFCGETFEVQKRRADTRKYCSLFCSNNAKQEATAD